MRQTNGLLPGGYIDEQGRLHCEVELAPLSGHEEELLAAHGHAPGAPLVTTLLSRCVRRVGSLGPLSEASARRLLVADRQYLLLKLREATFGSHVRSSIACPWPDCRQRIDVAFSLDAIPITASADKGPRYITQLSPEAAVCDVQGGPHSEVAFRLPNGGDQEALAELAAHNEARALTLLLQRCLLQIGPVAQPPLALVEQLSPLARLEIERAMQAAAPSLDLTMDSTCPECGRAYSVPFDLQGCLFGELRVSHDLLYREVHYLAYHYHWSEHEILAFSREKRRRYIEVLADEIERLNHGR
ncbi:MAG: hypothetical protein H7Y32_14575 [Chloroflexales bacterium]|nr:hypothetical protein [Chloroflexales bacterium]